MLGAQHSQNLDPMLVNVPGLKVVSVSTPYDGKGLLKSAIRDDNPVIFLESEMMYGMKGEVPDGEHIIPLGKGEIKRPGDGLTMVTWGKITMTALKAAEALAAEGIACEVIDVRTLVPLDDEMIFRSVKKTGRVVVVEENWPFASVGCAIVDRIQRVCFDDLDAPCERVAQEPVPVPYAENLEHLALPSVEKIVQACKRACYV